MALEIKENLECVDGKILSRENLIGRENKKVLKVISKTNMMKITKMLEI